MPATLAPSAATNNALRIWCDARQIYVELPTKAGLTPCIMTFSRDTRGLSRALATIFGYADNSSASPENFRAARKLTGTPVQHATAEAVLRRAGIIK